MPDNRKLGKPTDQRMAMLRGLVTFLIESGRIETTYTRAKEVSSIAERMITIGKKDTLAARRQALAFITKETAVEKLFTVVAPANADRDGGYTRVLKLGPRHGDAAEMALIEIISEGDRKAKEEEKKADKKDKKKTRAKKIAESVKAEPKDEKPEKKAAAKPAAKPAAKSATAPKPRAAAAKKPAAVEAEEEKAEVVETEAEAEVEEKAAEVEAEEAEEAEQAEEAAGEGKE